MKISNRSIVVMMLAGLIGSGLTFSAFATEAEKDLSTKIELLAALGPGVHKIKRDESGFLTSCVVVGQARISTALGQARGLQTARTSARLSAEKEFVKWFETHVRAVEYSGNQQIIMLESDGQNMTETGKSAETTAEAITAAASGALRGLTVLGLQQDGNGQLLTLVMGWKPEYAVSAASAQQVNESGHLPAPQVKEEKVGSPVDKNIPSKTTLSEEAGEFL